MEDKFPDYILDAYDQLFLYHCQNWATSHLFLETTLPEIHNQWQIRLKTKVGAQ